MTTKTNGGTGKCVQKRKGMWDGWLKAETIEMLTSFVLLRNWIFGKRVNGTEKFVVLASYEQRYYAGSSRSYGVDPDVLEFRQKSNL